MRSPHTKPRLLLLVLFLLTSVSLHSTPPPQLESQEQIGASTEESSEDYYRRWAMIRETVYRESLARVLVRHPRTSLRYKEALEVATVVTEAAIHHQADPLRTAALIIVESGGKPRSVSSADARGLMQILPSTGRFIAGARGKTWRGDSSLFDPAVNVDYGTWYFGHLQRQFGGNISAALAAYNWGPGTVQDKIRAGEKPPRVYASKVEAENKWLERELYREYNSYFWRRASELDNQFRSARGTARPSDSRPSPALSIPLG